MVSDVPADCMAEKVGGVAVDGVAVDDRSAVDGRLATTVLESF